MQCAGEPAGKQTMQSSAVLRLGVTSPSHVVPASFSFRSCSSLKSQVIPCKGSSLKLKVRTDEGPPSSVPLQLQDSRMQRRTALSFQIRASLAICISHQRKQVSSFLSPGLSGFERSHPVSHGVRKSGVDYVVDCHGRRSLAMGLTATWLQTCDKRTPSCISQVFRNGAWMCSGHDSPL